MSMNKINLLIDFSNIASKALYVARKNSKSKVFPSSQRDKETLIIQLHNAICYEINNFKQILKYVFICCDAKTTFRNKIYPDYKRTRKEKRDTLEDIDFNAYYKLLDEYIEYLKTIEFLTVVKYDELEADDLIAHIANDYYQKNISSIIISSDKDLHQLLQYDKETDTFIICYNNLHNKRSFTVTKHLLPSFTSERNVITNNIDVNTILEMMNDTHHIDDLMDYINALVDELKITIKVEIPNIVIIDKLFYGDTSDNIPGIVPKDMKTKIKFTRRQLPEILKFINLEIYNIIDELKIKHRDWLKYLAKRLEIGADELRIIWDNFKRNIELVYLNVNVYDIHVAFENKPFQIHKWKRDIPEMMKFILDIDDYDTVQKFKVFEY